MRVRGPGVGVLWGLDMKLGELAPVWGGEVTGVLGIIQARIYTLRSAPQFAGQMTLDKLCPPPLVFPLY